MKSSCSVCASFDRPMSIPVVKKDDSDPWCSEECKATFLAWTNSGSAMSLFQFHLRRKFPNLEASP